MRTFFRNKTGLAETLSSFACHHLHDYFYYQNNLNKTLKVSLFYLNLLLILLSLIVLVSFYLNQSYLSIRKYQIYYINVFIKICFFLYYIIHVGYYVLNCIKSTSSNPFVLSSLSSISVNVTLQFAFQQVHQSSIWYFLVSAINFIFQN